MWLKVAEKCDKPNTLLVGLFLQSEKNQHSHRQVAVKVPVDSCLTLSLLPEPLFKININIWRRQDFSECIYDDENVVCELSIAQKCAGRSKSTSCFIGHFHRQLNGKLDKGPKQYTPEVDESMK